MSLELGCTSTKGHKDENFPVASWLIEKRFRPCVMAYYAFARCADDISDHPDLQSLEKQEKLQRLDAVLCGALVADCSSAAEEAARMLRVLFLKNHLSFCHAQDLLQAFLQDTEKKRYETWEELMGYCAKSASPVGRFLLELHGEDPVLFPMSDALCNALQVINHLQDQAQDFLSLDRVYLPLEWMKQQDATVEMLNASSSSRELRAVQKACIEKTRQLLREAAPFPKYLKNKWLAFESRAILGLAHGLIRALDQHDPLEKRVVLGKFQGIFWSIYGIIKGTRAE